MWVTNTLGITLEILNNYPWTRLSMRIIGTLSKLTRRPRGCDHIQIFIQLRSEWCQGPSEFTWPWVLLNRVLLVDATSRPQAVGRRVSLLKLPNRDFKGGFPVMAETTRNHIFLKEISQVIIAAMVLAPHFYWKNCLRVISSLRRNHSQRVSKHSLARRTISCHCILMNIGLTGLSNRYS